MAASGKGINGVSTRGPPSRLLASNTRYPTAGTASHTPARRILRCRLPVESTNTGLGVEGDFTIAGSYSVTARSGRFGTEGHLRYCRDYARSLRLGRPGVNFRDENLLRLFGWG